MSKRSKHARRGEKPAALVKPALPVAKARDGRWTAAIVPILIVLVALLAYANSFSTAFVLDDMGNVENSYSIRSFMPTRTSLFGPPWRTFTGRPIVFWSFALNYRLNGLDVEGYHAFNVAVHILAALALWGVLRRTFRLSALQSEFAGVADTLATAITILWVVHPLTTAAVTYISQRAESLMAVTYFLTIYCFLRGIESGRSGRWYVVAVICCLLGVGCKEPIVTAPLFVLLYDRTLVAGSFAAALKQRRWLYAGLFGTWIPMGIVHAFHPHGTDAAFGYAEFTVWDNLRTQSRAIVQYLRLCFWPDQLILYYGRANKDISVPGNFWQYAPSGCIVLLLLGLSVWAVWKKLPMGLAGAWFFLILGPSSSVIVMPTEVIAEYRMYLPLVVVCAVAVVTFYVVGKHFVTNAGLIWQEGGKAMGAVVFTVALAALIMTTRRRNEDYRTPMDIWTDTVRKMPSNNTALACLAILEAEAGSADAESHLRAALERVPTEALAHAALGRILERQNRLPEAIEHYQAACEYLPGVPGNFLALSAALVSTGQLEQAITVLRAGAKVDPYDPNIWTSLGVLLIATGKAEEGQSALKRGLQIHPEPALAHFQIGQMAVEVSQWNLAGDHLRRALALSPGNAPAHALLGLVLKSQGRTAEALGEYRAAATLAPSDFYILNDLALIEATAAEASNRDGVLAMHHAKAAVDLSGRSSETLATLAAACAEAGQFDDAVSIAEEALRLSADRSRDDATVRAMQTRLELYRAGKPYHETATATTAPSTSP